jgi:hypothetical protein
MNSKRLSLTVFLIAIVAVLFQNCGEVRLAKLSALESLATTLEPTSTTEPTTTSSTTTSSTTSTTTPGPTTTTIPAGTVLIQDLGDQYGNKITLDEMLRGDPLILLLQTGKVFSAPFDPMMMDGHGYFSLGQMPISCSTLVEMNISKRPGVINDGTRDVPTNDVTFSAFRESADHCYYSLYSAPANFTKIAFSITPSTVCHTPLPAAGEGPWYINIRYTFPYPDHPTPPSGYCGFSLQPGLGN